MSHAVMRYCSACGSRYNYTSECDCPFRNYDLYDAPRVSFRVIPALVGSDDPPKKPEKTCYREQEDSDDWKPARYQERVESSAPVHKGYFSLGDWFVRFIGNMILGMSFFVVSSIFFIMAAITYKFIFGNR